MKNINLTLYDGDRQYTSPKYKHHKKGVFGMEMYNGWLAWAIFIPFISSVKLLSMSSSCFNLIADFAVVAITNKNLG